MKLLRIVVSVIFVITSAVFLYTYNTERKNTDNTFPEITIEEEIIDVGLHAKEEDMLKGVTAFDIKDGDITENVVVESVSKFIEKGVCKVTYAVYDSDNHVAKATRKIRYKDYTSPTFNLEDSICFSIYENIQLGNVIKASDCIDGDISNSIIITSEDYAGSVAGVFTMEASVTNKNGDTSTIKLPLIIEDRNLSAPKIELSDYLIYKKTNEQVDFKNYIVGAEDGVGRDLTSSVMVVSDVDFSKEGTYSVHYYVTDSNGLQGHTVLIVIVG